MRQWTVDAFTDLPFSGNSACVVEPMERWPEMAWMQALARENGAGATAFLVPREEAGSLEIRWFTPQVEVPLCGHATLAAAHVLFAEVGFEGETLRFRSPSGQLVVRQDGSAYQMNFPAPEARQIPNPPELCQALGEVPAEVWAGPYLIALFTTPDQVIGLSPNFDMLQVISSAHGGQGNVGVAALADETAPYEVIDRFFAPGYGIEEDAATGSFHCMLAPILSSRLTRHDIRFRQASPGRGADIRCRVEGERVLLTGQAVTVWDSILRVTPHQVSQVPANCAACT
ncbi:PhzF family phenazine biosynthesis protein [Sphingomonas sp.]|jgi:PhzF family phenazine biosynthesis protein|uniref:PhzF family phenazine biosynthesis protein n=1 Tax=Sphingomonas sp. TaxID=28214 RepID=UPI002DF467F0|nr:PhzF family phenazine biosynthesis protein [Sphingomonas sp.]